MSRPPWRNALMGALSGSRAAVVGAFGTKTIVPTRPMSMRIETPTNGHCQPAEPRTPPSRGPTAMPMPIAAS